MEKVTNSFINAGARLHFYNPVGLVRVFLLKRTKREIKERRGKAERDATCTTTA
jgi:hypothetical protein